MVLFGSDEEVCSSQMCRSLEMSSKQMANLFVPFVTAAGRRWRD